MRSSIVLKGLKEETSLNPWKNKNKKVYLFVSHSLSHKGHQPSTLNLEHCSEKILQVDVWNPGMCAGQNMHAGTMAVTLVHD